MNIRRKIMVGIAASLGLFAGLVPGTAQAVQGFTWTGIEPTTDGAILSVTFINHSGSYTGIYPIDLSLNGKVIATVTPTRAGEMKIPLNYKELGIAPGFGGTLTGRWSCGHSWGGGDRPSGKQLVLPKEAPPPVASGAIWQKRASAIGMRTRPAEPTNAPEAQARPSTPKPAPPKPVRPAKPAPNSTPQVDLQRQALQALKARLAPAAAAATATRPTKPRK